MIGNWNNSGLQILVSPYMLSKGDRPAAYSHPKDGVAPFPSFPLVTGEDVLATARLRETAYYKDGYTVCLDASSGHTDGIQIITDDFYIGPTDDYTFEFWFKYLGAGLTYLGRAGKKDSIEFNHSKSLIDSYSMGWKNQMYYYNEDETDNKRITVFSTSEGMGGYLEYGQIYYVVFSKKNGVVRPTYVNGQATVNDATWSNSTDVPPYPIDNINPDFPLTFGIHSAVDGVEDDPEGMHFYSGAYYNRALSEEEIKNNYALGPDYGGLKMFYDNQNSKYIIKATNHKSTTQRSDIPDHYSLLGSSSNVNINDNKNWI